MRPRTFALTVAALVVAAGVGVPASGQSWSKILDSLRQAGESALQSVRLGPQSGKGAGGSQSVGPPPEVVLSQPMVRNIAEWDEYTGRFAAIEAVDVRARVSGYLDSVHFADGETVAKGQLLYVIDPRPFERALALAEAELAAAKVRVENARLDVDRGEPLMKRGVMSEKVFDDRANVLRDAAAQARVAEERVKTAKLELSFTRIEAPVAGRIGRSEVTRGNFVSAGASSGATLLTRIVSQDPIYIEFDIGELNAIKYARLHENAGLIGKPVEVGLPDEKGFPHKGALDFLDNRLDPGTGTLAARARLANPSGLFSPGMFARARLQGAGAYDAVLLPDAAVGTDQVSRFVYVVGADDVPAQRRVVLGPLIDGLRVIREGITAEEWVVVKGQQRVRAGQKVIPRREALQVSDAPATTANPPRIERR
ncbi:MAG: efflux RND transporter periplasmic adaptor subunit [Pseudomonadota bacterium]